MKNVPFYFNDYNIKVCVFNALYNQLPYKEACYIACFHCFFQLVVFTLQLLSLHFRR